MIRFRLIIAVLLAAFIVSCENESYDTGDGQLSNVTTAFGETCYDADGYAYRFVTDDDKTLDFTSVYGKQNTKLAGKENRSLFYYYLTENENIVKPYAIMDVLTADVIDKNKIKYDRDDPMKVEAAWISPNKKYLNLSLKIKTSVLDDNNSKHILGAVYEGTHDGCSEIRMIHDNGNIPGNYTANVYFSVRVKSITARNPQCNVVRLNVNTEEGLKTFELEM